MSSSWPQIDDLIRELGEVCALPEADGEPSLSLATMAVSKAASVLARAAGARGRGSAGVLAQAMTAVEEARGALQRARVAIAASNRRRGIGRAAVPAAVAAATVAGEAEATCPACRCRLLVRYRAVSAAPVVAFPVACPADRCDGVSEVTYPASAVDVVVEPAP